MFRLSNALPLGIFLIAMMGCASTSNNPRDNDFTAQINSSPEVIEIDQDLEKLARDTDALEKEYDEIQKTVLANAKFEGEEDKSDEKLVIDINENNAILVNDKPMSKNEFASYIDKKLPALCTPTPTINLSTRADYTIAASLLEMIYARGCTNVTFE